MLSPFGTRQPLQICRIAGNPHGLPNNCHRARLNSLVRSGTLKRGGRRANCRLAGFRRGCGGHDARKAEVWAQSRLAHGPDFARYFGRSRNLPGTSAGCRRRRCKTCRRGQRRRPVLRRVSRALRLGLWPHLHCPRPCRRAAHQSQCRRSFAGRRRLDRLGDWPLRAGARRDRLDRWRSRGQIHLRPLSRVHEQGAIRSRHGLCPAAPGQQESVECGTLQLQRLRWRHRAVHGFAGTEIVAHLPAGVHQQYAPDQHAPGNGRQPHRRQCQGDGQRDARRPFDDHHRHPHRPCGSQHGAAAAAERRTDGDHRSCSRHQQFGGLGRGRRPSAQ